MRSGDPLLSVIVVHYRNPAMLKLCLASIRDACASIDYELIVVDSESSQQAANVVSDYSETAARYMPFKSNIGYPRGVNEGLKQARGSYFLILNYDLILDPESVNNMLYYLKSHPKVGLVGPRLLNFNGDYQRSYFRFYRPITILGRRSSLLSQVPFIKRHLESFVMSDTDSSEVQTPDWLMGSALMTRRDAVERVGLMDQRFFMYFEDVDWARRFWHNGYTVVYFPKAVVHHYHGKGSISKWGLLDFFVNKKTRWHIASAARFFWKYRNLQKFKYET